MAVGFVNGGAASLQQQQQLKKNAAVRRSAGAAALTMMAWGGNKSRFSSGFGSNDRKSGKGRDGAGREGGAGGFGGAGSGPGSGSGSGSDWARGAGGAGDNAGGANPFLTFWKAYNSALESKPLLIKALTSLVGFSLGDILAQKFLGAKDAAFDTQRLARMALFGLLIHGPTGHYFYGALDRAIPGTEAWKVAAKVGIDQVLWAPIFTVMFFAFIGLLEGRSRAEIEQKVKRDTWTGVKGSWKVWPVVHTINFRFIPSSQRLLYINTIQIAYNMFLSLIANKEEVPVPKKK